MDERPRAPRGHIVLVGLPGAGKTTVGRELAGRLGRPFVDFDEEIVRRTGMTVAEIFAGPGERHFRDLEAQLTREMADRPPAVLAPGGGWLMQPGLPDLLGSALLVHLRVTPATAVARMASEVESRPLLAGGDAPQRLEALRHLRQAKYATVPLQVDTELLGVQEVVSAILAALPGPA